jgi:hypothetical protein
MKNSMKSVTFGGSILGAAMALTGCMGGAGVSTSDLALVPAAIDGRTDMFLEGNRLITAAELGDSTTAIPVEVNVDEWTLTATRLGSTEILAHWDALDVVSAEDIAFATPIDGELNPGSTDPVTLPRGELPSFGHGNGSGTIPGGDFDAGDHLIIDWSELPGLVPGEVDAREFEGLDGAHPGCA